MILSTADVEEFSYEEAMDSGASDFITKPFAPADLVVARVEHDEKPFGPAEFARFETQCVTLPAVVADQQPSIRAAS